jgi:hypothetical protein
MEQHPKGFAPFLRSLAVFLLTPIVALTAVHSQGIDPARYAIHWGATPVVALVVVLIRSPQIVIDWADVTRYCRHTTRREDAVGRRLVQAAWCGIKTSGAWSVVPVDRAA